MALWVTVFLPMCAIMTLVYGCWRITKTSHRLACPSGLGICMVSCLIMCWTRLPIVSNLTNHRWFVWVCRPPRLIPKPPIVIRFWALNMYKTRIRWQMSTLAKWGYRCVILCRQNQWRLLRFILKVICSTTTPTLSLSARLARWKRSKKFIVLRFITPIPWQVKVISPV